MKRTIVTCAVLMAVFVAAALALSTDVASYGTGSDSGTLSKVVLNVEGMTCSGCVYTIKTSLAGLEGIEDIQVDVSSGMASVTFDRDKLGDVEKLAQAITNSGYKATVARVVDADTLTDERRTADIRAKTAIASVGGLEIPRPDFEAELAHARSRYEAAYGKGVFSDPRGARLLDNLKYQIARKLIDEGIQLQEVQRAGYKMNDSKLDQEMNAFLNERGMSRSKLKSALEENGYPFEYFMRRFQNRVLIETYVDENVIAGLTSDFDKQSRYADWFANARLLADVVYYDRDIERLVQAQSAGSGCGSSCSR
ncbi:hypothetical protein D3OALGA1CA_2506 [Olavius algarvensis associated proteobacterium Delta 3]|nr:hypothetical protein D3OALGA1CA_2506 [Olavius algarvensis associated proteobacterium Delta 3]